MYKAFLVLFITSLGVLTACKQGVEQPENLLSEQQMIDVLVDVYIFEGARTKNLKGFGKDTSKIAGVYSEIYSKHNVRQEDFKASYTYYSLEKKKLTKIFDKVLERYSKMEAELKRLPPDPLEKADSVRAASDSAIGRDAVKPDPLLKRRK